MKIFERTDAKIFDLDFLFKKNIKEEHKQFLNFTAKATVLKSNADYIPNPPKYLLLENVPELVTRKNHMANF